MGGVAQLGPPAEEDARGLGEAIGVAQKGHGQVGEGAQGQNLHLLGGGGQGAAQGQDPGQGVLLSGAGGGLCRRDHGAAHPLVQGGISPRQAAALLGGGQGLPRAAAPVRGDGRADGVAALQQGRQTGGARPVHVYENG